MGLICNSFFLALSDGNRASSFAWPRAGDQDVHKSPSAWLPVRAGRHVGDADKSPKQIEITKPQQTMNTSRRKKMTPKTDLAGSFTLPATSMTVSRMGYGAMQLAGPE